MPSTPALEILRKGLNALKNQVKKRKDALLERLNKKEKISAADEEWLDQGANHIEEDQLLDKLETVSDYERGLARLDSKEKGMVEKLEALGRDSKGTAPAVSNKRKSVLFFLSPHIKI
jgi:ribosome assembly protein YihI (activator of Der GTPase)